MCRVIAKRKYCVVLRSLYIDISNISIKKFQLDEFVNDFYIAFHRNIKVNVIGWYVVLIVV